MLNENIEKYQVVNGKTYLMSPSPNYRHSEIVTNLIIKLSQGMDRSVCRVYGDNVDMSLDDTKDFVIPDVSIICDKSKFKNGKYYGVPKFIVEVLSPSTRKLDLTDKKDYYEKNGVNEYWIIDYKACSLDVYHLIDKKYVLTESYQLDEDNIESQEEVITLRDFPHIKVTMKEIFE